MKMPNLYSWFSTLLLPTVIILICGFVFWLFLIPSQNRSDQLAVKNDLLSQLTKQSIRLERRLVSLSTFNDGANNNQFFQTSDGNQILNFQNHIATQIRANGLRAQRTQTRTNDINEEFTQTIAIISLEASEEQLISFLDTIENGEKLIKVETADISQKRAAPNSNTTLMQIQLTLHGFVKNAI